jgi:hypothetical protein
MDRDRPHQITGVDAAARTGTCSVCGPVRVHRAKRSSWRCATRGNADRRQHRSGASTPRAPRVLPPLTDVEVAWIAGLLEGEGHFAPKAIIVNMTDRDVLERLAALTGGRLNGPYTYKNRPTSKPYYRVWIP